MSVQFDASRLSSREETVFVTTVQWKQKTRKVFLTNTRLSFREKELRFTASFVEALKRQTAKILRH